MPTRQGNITIMQRTKKHNLSRRDFLKLAALGAGVLALRPFAKQVLYDAWGNRVDAWETPVGESPIWRKAVSLPLSGGSAAAGWSLPAVGWVSLFVGTGVAIHSTYWHNNYGEPSSRGCVNASPEDAKWIFRWSQPGVPYDPGDVTVEMPGGTKVSVEKNWL